MKKILATILCIALCLLFCVESDIKAAEADEIIKIGLAYNTDALSSANLQNATGYGSGYGLGYFDSAKSFINIYNIDEIYLTILKDKPMYIGEGNVYFDTTPSSYKYTVGSYHLECGNSFATAQEAAAYAQQLTSAGIKAFPAYVGGGFRVRIRDYMTDALASAEIAELSASVAYPLQVAGNSRSCYTVTVTGTDKILFEFDTGGGLFGIMPKGNNGSAAQTWFRKYKYYGGFEYDRVNGNDITIMSVVTQSDYLKGVVPYEMSASWPIEALKVQAICARSYAYNSMGRHGAQGGFDLCNTTHCQVYYGTNSANATSDRAVTETADSYVLYGGRVADTFYHSSSGGATENVENVWNESLPYLRGVKDSYLTVTKPWGFEATISQITQILQAKGKTTKNIIDFYVSQYTAMGNVKEITFVEQGGGKLTYKGDTARIILNNVISGINVGSLRYTIGSKAALYVNNALMDKPLQQYYAIGSGGAPSYVSGATADIRLISGSGVSAPTLSQGTFSVSGTGSGHNVGMSQWGAHAMAQAGLSYDKIVKHYFTGVEIGRVD